MQVSAITPETRWHGGIKIEFDSKKEAEVFFSVFNTSRIADAVNDLTANRDFSHAIYDLSEQLGVSKNTYVSEIHDRLKR